MSTATTAAVATKLPPPNERPGSDIVIYDGQCRFCTAQVQNLARWDTKHRLSFLSLHESEVARRFPDLTHERLMAAMYVVDAKGKRYAGADAFGYLTTRLPRLYLLAPLMHIPFTGPLWRWAYRQVAKRRYAIAGKSGGACDSDACSVHFK